MAKVDRNGAVWGEKEIRELKAEYLKSGRHTCEDFDRIAAKFFVREIPEKRQCEEFLRDCRGMLYGDSRRENVGSWTTEELIERFHGNKSVRDFVDACILWRLTERQGGGLVI